MGEFKLIKEWEIDSPVGEIKIATGRAKCRICGVKIGKGEKEMNFYHSFSDAQYNAWTSVDCHVHLNCLVNQKPW